MGCTREIFFCWQIWVQFAFVEGTLPYKPPWGSLATFIEREMAVSRNGSTSPAASRLYPNVRGCGYPPQLDCDEFYERFGPRNTSFNCYVSTLDNQVALTELDLERAKYEVLYSLIPLFVFIMSVLYAFCRMGIFVVCNPFRSCSPAKDAAITIEALTPRRLYNYKKALLARQQHLGSKTDLYTVKKSPRRPPKRSEAHWQADIEEQENEDMPTSTLLNRRRSPDSEDTPAILNY